MQTSNEPRERVKETAVEGVKETKRQAQNLASAGISRAGDELRGLGQALTSTSESLSSEGSMLADTVEQFGDRVGRFADRLSEQSPTQLQHDTERWARTNPWLFLGGCFLGGVVAGRFIRASQPQQFDYPAGDRLLPSSGVSRSPYTVREDARPSGYADAGYADVGTSGYAMGGSMAGSGGPSVSPTTSRKTSADASQTASQTASKAANKASMKKPKASKSSTKGGAA